MAGKSLARSASFTRPANQSSYAVGDLVANTTSAGSVTPLSWTLPEGGGFLRRIELFKDDVDLSSAAFRLWLASAAPAFANGDNGTLSIASGLTADQVFVALDITPAESLVGIGDYGFAVYREGQHYLGGGTIYGWLEARGVYTPASGESFTVNLRIDPYY